MCIRDSCNGCVIADKNQVVDNNTLIDHQVGHCTSNELCLLYTSTCSTTVRVSLQVEHVSLEEHLVEQIVNTDTLLGTDFLALILTTPLLNEQVHVSQVLTDTVWVSTCLLYTSSSASLIAASLYHILIIMTF